MYLLPERPGHAQELSVAGTGAQRALRNRFDPFEQTRSRLTALNNVGHPIQKVEILILGGTWSAYPHGYQEWFIHRCLDALNGQESATLAEAQDRNEQAPSRCVGLTVETRPDWITPEEVVRLRQLGVARVQIGIQSLDDRILALNNRGHDMAAARYACRLLRAAGFKLLLTGCRTSMVRRRRATGRTSPGCGPIPTCSRMSSRSIRPRWSRTRNSMTCGGKASLCHRGADIDRPVGRLQGSNAVYCRLSRVVRDIHPITWSRAIASAIYGRRCRRGWRPADAAAAAFDVER